MRWSKTAPPSTVRVPELVGLAVRVAQDVALDTGLLAVLPGVGRGLVGQGAVVRQSPVPGTEVRVATRVRIWVDPPPGQTDPDDDEDGGGGGGGSWLPVPPGPKVPAGTK